VTRSTGGQPLDYEHPTKPHAVYDAQNPGKYAYDAAGNLTRREDQTLVYDARNRLGSVSGKPLTLLTSFKYDPYGERSIRVHGADRSVFFGRDLEIVNNVRFVRSVYAAGMLVARRAFVPVGNNQGAKTIALWKENRRELGYMFFSQALVGSLLLLAMLALRATRGLPVARAAVSGGVAFFLLILPTGRAYASIPDGDLNDDGKIDAADTLLALSFTSGRAEPDASQSIMLDVAPLETNPNGETNSADALLILREATQGDVDADGLDAATEIAFGMSPFRHDSDRDGINDEVEVTDSDEDSLSYGDELDRGSDPSLADSDGDGLVDGKDGDPLTMEIESLHFVHTDHLGGVAGLTNASGTVVRRVYYDIWGAPRRDELVTGAPNTTPKTREGFTGQTGDGSTGLIYYGARYYDPVIGRFIQPDPIIPNVFNPQNLNRYTYVLNDPLNRIDPTGNFSFASFGSAVWGGISSAASAVGNFLGNAWGSLVDASASMFNSMSQFAGYMTQSALAFADFAINLRIWSDPAMIIGGIIGFSPAAAQEQKRIADATQSANLKGRNPPDVTPGRIDPGEPIASDPVRAGMWQAWVVNRPGFPGDSVT